MDNLTKFCETHDIKYLAKIKDTYIINLLLKMSKYCIDKQKGYRISTNNIKFL